ncbi:MAG TPA: VOC family protein [Anaerolineales bacterium]
MSLPSESLSKTEFSIHPKTQIGHVSLTVADLDRQVEFYERVIGLQLRERNGNTASLGAGREELLTLTELKEAGRRRGTTGLYHFAILLPDRRELARAMSRLFAMHYRNYPTDHIMTKTTYLDDLEGNGIELYAESPEDGTWSLANGEYVTRRADGSLSDGREPLDVDALLTHLKEGDRLDAPMPPETKVGHVHLHVRNIAEAVDFYHRIIGFDVMGIARAFRMAFVSAGGYHHHIGLNTWQGEGAPAPAPNSLGLRHFSVMLPDAAALEQVLRRVREAGLASEEIEAGVLLRDPSQNGVLLTSRGS